MFSPVMGLIVPPPPKLYVEDLTPLPQDVVPYKYLIGNRIFTDVIS